MGHKIAVYDACTMVGHDILEILSNGQVNVGDVMALSTSKQTNREVSFGDKDLQTKSIDHFDFSTCDIFFHTDPRAISTDILDKALRANVKVVDVCGHYLFQNEKGTNGQMVSLASAIGAQLTAVLRPLHAVAKIKRVVVSTYESTSAEGKDGMDELFNQSRKFFVHDAMENFVFGKQIAYNVIPQVGAFQKDGQTESEWRLAADIKNQIDKTIKVAATCVQVPVFIGHCASVMVEFVDSAPDDFDAKAARALWREEDDIVVIDTESEMEFVTPIDIVGEDSVFISRVRNDSTVDNGISFWCAADNIRATIAHKAVQAMKKFEA